MNYLKSALAGFGMSFIGTALCGAKMGVYYQASYLMRIHRDVYLKMLKVGDGRVAANLKYFNIFTKDYDLATKNHQGILNFEWKDFQYKKYAKDFNIDNRNNWYNVDSSKWSVTKAFLINNAICIPTALLGALFHDKVSRDFTPKINSYFDSEISPYLVTGGVFGTLGTVGMAASSLVSSDPTQPWIYSMSIIEGFVIGATAMAGAYFGDEMPLDTAVELESTVELDFEKSDQQIDI